MLSYRYDYMAPGADRETVIQVPEGRTECMRQAARASRRFGTAYAIATRDGADTGQRVYSDGRFSYQDDEF